MLREAENIYKADHNGGTGGACAICFAEIQITSYSGLRIRFLYHLYFVSI